MKAGSVGVVPFRDNKPKLEVNEAFGRKYVIEEVRDPSSNLRFKNEIKSVGSRRRGKSGARCTRDPEFTIRDRKRSLYGIISDPTLVTTSSDMKREVIVIIRGTDRSPMLSHLRD